MRVSPTAAVLMGLATAMWGGHYVLASVASRALSPFDLTFWRWLIAVIPLLLIAQLVERPDWRTVLRAWPRIVLLAALGMLAYNLLLYTALRFTTSIGASIVNAANPALMALLGTWLLRERLGGRQVGGIAISLIGVLLVISGGSPLSLLSLDVNPGQLLMIGAIAAWSLYSIWGRVPGVPPIASTAAQAIVVVVAMAPLTPVAGLSWPTDAAASWSLLYIAILPSVGSYVLWNAALRTTPTGLAAIFLNLITVFTVIIGATTGERLAVVDMLGGTIIIAGVLVTSWPSRSASGEPRSAAPAPNAEPHDAEPHAARRD
ncbi:MAG: DMT family transporter [Microbacteriaceae bacterium]